jgi:hypothetical protein
MPGKRKICKSSSNSPQGKFISIGRFAMHESLCEFPILIEALEIVSYFIDTLLFEYYINKLRGTKPLIPEDVIREKKESGTHYAIPINLYH